MPLAKTWVGVLGGVAKKNETTLEETLNAALGPPPLGRSLVEIARSVLKDGFLPDLGDKLADRAEKARGVPDRSNKALESDFVLALLAAVDDVTGHEGGYYYSLSGEQIFVFYESEDGEVEYLLRLPSEAEFEGLFWKLVSGSNGEMSFRSDREGLPLPRPHLGSLRPLNGNRAGRAGAGIGRRGGRGGMKKRSLDAAKSSGSSPGVIPFNPTVKGEFYAAGTNATSTLELTSDIVPTATPAKRKRGKSLSRRTGQSGQSKSQEGGT